MRKGHRSMKESARGKTQVFWSFNKAKRGIGREPSFQNAAAERK